MLLFLMSWTTQALAADPAGTSDGFDAHGFVLAAMDGDVRDPLYLQRPGWFAAGDYFAGGVLEYAKSPLRRVTLGDSGDELEDLSFVDNLFAADLSLGVSVHDRVRLDVAAPIYFLSTMEGEGPQGAGLGDLRASAMVQVIRADGFPDDGAFGLGLIPYLDLPTGREDIFLGQPGLAGGGTLAGTWERGPFTGVANLGLQFNPAVAQGNFINSDALTLGVGGGYLVEPDLGVNLETHLSVPLKASADPSPGSAAPAELLASVRKRMSSGAFLVGGAGVGLDKGVSAAAFRLFLGGGFGKLSSPVPPDKDTDGDGILDRLDACPLIKETFNGYKDEDGCPDELAKVSVVVARNGTPVSGAATTLVRGDQETAHVSDAVAPWTHEAMPGETWDIRAALAPCYAGQVRSTLVEGPQTLTVPLDPQMHTKVIYTVVDGKGRPISNALVEWIPRDGSCQPTEALGLPGGTGSQLSGAGPGRIIVSAGEDYATQEVAVDVPPSGEYPVRVVLPKSLTHLGECGINLDETVQFEYDSAVIQSVSFPLLQEVAAMINRYPGVGRIEVGGHASSEGKDSYNLALSSERARSVKNFLVKQGVPAQRLDSVGYGETRPVSSNATQAGRERNRRVEVLFVDKCSDGKVRPDQATPPGATPSAK